VPDRELARRRFGECFVDVNNTLVLNTDQWGTEEQKLKYGHASQRIRLRLMHSAKRAKSLDICDRIATRQRRRHKEAGLNGRKLWITNSLEAGLFLLFANAQPEKGYKGITAFIVEKEFPGFSVGHKEDKLGIRASSTCELILEDCHVEKACSVSSARLQDRYQTLNEGESGSARRCSDWRRRLRMRACVYERAQAIRTGDLISGRSDSSPKWP
jgi:alkylation response protein AidB-like acyl-CoA dehydrogenase